MSCASEFTARPARSPRWELGFRRPPTTRGLIEHRIDEAVPVGRAKAARQPHRLVDDYAPGYVGPMLQLENAHQQQPVLDGVELRGCAVQERCELRVELLVRGADTAHQRLEILRIPLARSSFVRELLHQVLPGTLVELPAVQ